MMKSEKSRFSPSPAILAQVFVGFALILSSVPAMSRYVIRLIRLIGLFRRQAFVPASLL